MQTRCLGNSYRSLKFTARRFSKHVLKIWIQQQRDRINFAILKDLLSLTSYDRYSLIPVSKCKAQLNVGKYARVLNQFSLFDITFICELQYQVYILISCPINKAAGSHTLELLKIGV